MNRFYYVYPCLNPYCNHVPMHNWDASFAEGYGNQFFQQQNIHRAGSQALLKDQGNKPFVININQAAKQNHTYRDTIWTGKHLQVTLMSINAGEDIGLEIHPDVDQFLRIEEGQGIVKMGKRKSELDFEKYVGDDSAIFIPSGTWHNVINTGNTPLKLYSIYGPPNHPFGTVHRTKAEAEAAGD